MKTKFIISTPRRLWASIVPGENELDAQNSVLPFRLALKLAKWGATVPCDSESGHHYAEISEPLTLIYSSMAVQTPSGLGFLAQASGVHSN